MERIYVESSRIQSIGYDLDNSILEIEFKNNGAIYQYYDVPLYEYEELMNAESKGKYLSTNLKNYKYQRVG